MFLLERDSETYFNEEIVIQEVCSYFGVENYFSVMFLQSLLCLLP